MAAETPTQPPAEIKAEAEVEAEAEAAEDAATAGTEANTPGPSVAKIHELLQSQDDTSRFVGLALLKSVLDNSPDLQKDDDAIVSLWNSISPKFLDRLLKSGSRPASHGSKARDMLDLAVAVLHTFAVLLPEATRRENRLLSKIPALTAAVLYSSKETTAVILETLLSLVSTPEGAALFVQLDVEEYSPLLEIAPEYPHVLPVLRWAWQQGSLTIQNAETRSRIRQNIDQGIQALVSSYSGTDAISLLEFLPLLSSLELDLIPNDPQWLASVTRLIRNLCTNRPTAQGRSAYTNCAGTLLLLYPEVMPKLLFAGNSKDSAKPFSYLFISLVLVDIRATLPSLLNQLNDPEYPQVSRRLSSGLDILTAFIGYLIAWMERLDDPDNGASMSAADALDLEPDLMLKLSKSIAETIAVTMEFLRDRWDASVAGAHGLHPEARVGEAHTSSGSRRTVAWDSKGDNATTDPLTLSAIRAIALWLRDDDGDVLRKQGAGLVDMLLELYQSSSPSPTQTNPQGLDFRLPALTALEGILRTENGIEAFSAENGWQVLAKDLVAVLSLASDPSTIIPSDCIRGTRIVFVLELVVQTAADVAEQWMDVVTGVAAFDAPDDRLALKDNALLDLMVDAVWLAASLLQRAGPGMRRRYVHSASAVRGIAQQLRGAVDPVSKSASELDEALAIVAAL